MFGVKKQPVPEIAAGSCTYQWQHTIYTITELNINRLLAERTLMKNHTSLVLNNDQGIQSADSIHEINLLRSSLFTINTM